MALSERSNPRRSASRKAAPQTRSSGPTKRAARVSKKSSSVAEKPQQRRKTRGAARGEATPSRATRPRTISTEERQRLIAETAYLKAERRGFKGNDPRRDWFEAEAEVDAMLLQNEIFCE